MKNENKTRKIKKKPLISKQRFAHTKFSLQQSPTSWKPCAGANQQMGDFVHILIAKALK